jgi:hypothetical protein
VGINLDLVGLDEIGQGQELLQGWDEACFCFGQHFLSVLNIEKGQEVIEAHPKDRGVDTAHCTGRNGH